MQRRGRHAFERVAEAAGWPAGAPRIPLSGIQGAAPTQSVPMTSIPRPDLSARPHTTSCERTVSAPPRKVFAAWTQRFDAWFAQPGTVAMVPEPGRPYFFYNREEWGRHPHYGRFLELRTYELVEMTWLTGNGTAEGTEGAETVLRIELAPAGDGTRIRLTHSGFVSERSRDGHAENWPLALEILGEALGGPGRDGGFVDE